MGLIKDRILNNGITLKYHRIVSLTCITNHANIIEVASYTSEEKRNEEKTSFEEGVETGSVTPIDVFINTEVIETKYDQNMSIITAYEYLKTLDEFSGAVDDLKKEEVNNE